MQAARSELNRKAKTFPIQLENTLHSFTSHVHPAQVSNQFAIQHERILHHVAFPFFLHPGHFPERNFRRAPQYNPQKAMRFVSEIIGPIDFK